MKKEKSNGITIGYASIITVFMILIFVTFSILSFRQASSSLSRVERTIEVLNANYEADTAGMKMKMKIDDMLKNSKTIDEAIIAIKNEVESINIYDNMVEYTIIINDKAKLEVLLTIDQIEMKSEINSWKIITTNEEGYTQQGFDF